MAPGGTILDGLHDQVRQVLREELPGMLHQALASALTPRPSSGEAYLTVDAVAERVSVIPATVRTWIGEGKLKAHQVGRSWRIRPDDLDAFIRREEQPKEVDIEAEARRMLQEVAEREAAKEVVREEAARKGEKLDRWEERRRVDAYLREQGQLPHRRR